MNNEMIACVLPWYSKSIVENFPNASITAMTEDAKFTTRSSSSSLMIPCTYISEDVNERKRQIQVLVICFPKFSTSSNHSTTIRTASPNISSTSTRNKCHNNGINNIKWYHSINNILEHIRTIYTPYSKTESL